MIKRSSARTKFASGDLIVRLEDQNSGFNFLFVLSKGWSVMVNSLTIGSDRCGGRCGGRVAGAVAGEQGRGKVQEISLESRRSKSPLSPPYFFPLFSPYCYCRFLLSRCPTLDTFNARVVNVDRANESIPPYHHAQATQTEIAQDHPSSPSSNQCCGIQTSRP